MRYDYLDRIRRSVNLSTKRKTSNVLDGSFSSVFRGRSLEFEDLKEYDFGDNVHDIDWKSSSRTGRVRCSWMRGPTVRWPTRWRGRTSSTSTR